MKTISRANLPPELPLTSSVVAWLLLDRLQAPDWVCGAVGLFFVLAWIGIIAKLLKAEFVDIFESKK